MALVIDASIVGPWLFDDEDHATSETALRRLGSEEAVVPVHWWLEVSNLLLVSERRGRIAKSDVDASLKDLHRLPIISDKEIPIDDLLGLARAHRLTCYDAAYLELATRTALPLATLDAALSRAAAAEGVTLVA